MKIKILFFLYLAICASTYGQENFVLAGNARYTGEQCFHLTGEYPSQFGAIWSNDKISLANSFELNVTLFFGCNDNGADGIVFALQQQSQNAGAPGGGLGIMNVKPSIAVEFDTYPNGNVSDIGEDHIAIYKDGDINHASANTLLSPVTANASGNIEDCREHQVKISWDAVPQKLSVYFDCILKADITYDLIKHIFNNDPMVYWGFTAATGGAFNHHKVCIIETNLINVKKEFSLCKGDSVQLRGKFGKTFKWAPGTALSSDNRADIYTKPASSVQYVLTREDFCNNFYHDTFNITVNDVSNFLKSIPTSCSYASYKLYSDQEFVKYLWSTGELNNEITVNQPGSYWLQVMDKNGCMGKQSVSIQLNKPRLEINNVYLCEGDSVILDGGDGKNHLWQPDYNISSVNARAPFVKPEITTSYIISKTDTCNEEVSDTVKITVIKIPAFLENNSVPFCEDTAVVLQPKYSFIKYLWNTGINTENLYAKANGIYWLEVTDSFGCKKTDTAIVSGWRAKPVPGISKTIEYWSESCLDTIITLNANPGYLSYLWSIGDTDNSISITNEGIFWIKITNEACEIIDTITVLKRCFPILLFPDAFTPNGDLLNDTWKVHCESCTEIDVKIFNRWGEEVYSADKPDFEWNGIYKGQSCPNDIYFFILRYKGYGQGIAIRVFNQKGVITLLR